MAAQQASRKKIVPDRFPPLTHPGLESSRNCCVWRINKRFEGPVTSETGISYDCETGKTRRRKTQITFRIFHAGNCDEIVIGFPPDGLLTADGTTYHRRDNLAHFMGQFILKQMPSGEPLFKGTIEILGRAGSHQSTEQCDEDKHIEGWLVGKGTGALSRYTLRAVLQGFLHKSFPDGTALIPQQNRISGVVMKAG